MIYKSTKFFIDKDLKGGEEIVGLNSASKSVMVLPLTSDRKIVFIEKYMPTLNKSLLVLPGGRFDDGEFKRQGIVLRELREETGMSSDDLIELGSVYILPRYLIGETYFFVARNCKFVGVIEDSKEVSKVVIKDREAVIDMLNSGYNLDARTMALLYRAKEYYV